MLIKIGQFDITECWDGVFYKKLSDYPNITDWEIQTILDFIKYEEKNGRSCSIEADENISVGFTPGVRFFFLYDDMAKHPNVTYEGVLPLKIKNEVILKDWVTAIIAPKDYEQILNPHIPDYLKSKIHFLQNNCKDIWEWSEQVYEYAKKA